MLRGVPPSAYHVRPYEPRDRERVYRICLETGDTGKDATKRYKDAHVLGHVYAGPYVDLSPELAFVLDDGNSVDGYVLGALDSRAFEQLLEERWWPALRARYPMPASPRETWSADEHVVSIFHHPHVAQEEFVRTHPSHLHIDLLPQAQGAGNGRRLMTALLDALASRGSPGVHLGVGRQNENAVGFYRHVGFTVLRDFPGWLLMGMDLRGRRS
jgi:ribosomal protein S18 acetylase RimI-like enzyme